MGPTGCAKFELVLCLIMIIEISLRLFTVPNWMLEVDHMIHHINTADPRSIAIIFPILKQYDPPPAIKSATSAHIHAQCQYKTNRLAKFCLFRSIFIDLTFTPKKQAYFCKHGYLSKAIQSVASVELHLHLYICIVRTSCLLYSVDIPFQSLVSKGLCPSRRLYCNPEKKI